MLGWCTNYHKVSNWRVSNWIQYCWVTKKCFVVYCHKMWKMVESDITYGSVVGTFLFLIHINNLGKSMNKWISNVEDTINWLLLLWILTGALKFNLTWINFFVGLISNIQISVAKIVKYLKLVNQTNILIVT